MLKVDRNTMMEDFAPFANVLTAQQTERLKEGAVRDLYGEHGFMSMPIRDLTDVLQGDNRPLHIDGTVFGSYRYIAAVEWFADFVEQLGRLTLPPTPEQTRHAQGCLPCSIDKAIYFFLRSHFGLHSYAEADALTVADLLLAKEEAYNVAVVERNIANQLKEKGTRK